MFRYPYIEFCAAVNVKIFNATASVFYSCFRHYVSHFGTTLCRFCIKTNKNKPKKPRGKHNIYILAFTARQKLFFDYFAVNYISNKFAENYLQSNFASCAISSRFCCESADTTVTLPKMVTFLLLAKASAISLPATGAQLPFSMIAIARFW